MFLLVQVEVDLTAPDQAVRQVSQGITRYRCGLTRNLPSRREFKRLHETNHLGELTQNTEMVCDHFLIVIRANPNHRLSFDCPSVL